MTENGTRVPILTGGCQCGAVRYGLYSRPEGSHLCHCRTCQKGSAGRSRRWPRCAARTSPGHGGSLPGRATVRRWRPATLILLRLRRRRWGSLTRLRLDRRDHRSSMCRPRRRLAGTTGSRTGCRGSRASWRCRASRPRTAWPRNCRGASSTSSIPTTTRRMIGGRRCVPEARATSPAPLTTARSIPQLS